MGAPDFWYWDKWGWWVHGKEASTPLAPTVKNFDGLGWSWVARDRQHRRMLGRCYMYSLQYVKAGCKSEKECRRFKNQQAVWDVGRQKVETHIRCTQVYRIVYCIRDNVHLPGLPGVPGSVGKWSVTQPYDSSELAMRTTVRRSAYMYFLLKIFHHIFTGTARQVKAVSLRIGVQELLSHYSV